MDVSKNRGKTPKMDGENNGKPYEQMDDLGGNTPIFGNTHHINRGLAYYSLIRKANDDQRYYLGMLPHPVTVARDKGL